MCRGKRSARGLDAVGFRLVASRMYRKQRASLRNFWTLRSPSERAAMGNRAVNFVRESRRAGGFAQAVLLYLAECMNDVTGQCNPSRDTIAEFFSSEDSPCTIKRVERALARLRELGFIVSTRVPYSRQTEFGMEGGWSNSYTLVGYETGATPKTCVTPILSGGHPQNGQWPHFVWGSPPKWAMGHPHIVWGSPPKWAMGHPHFVWGSPPKWGHKTERNRRETERTRR